MRGHKKKSKQEESTASISIGCWGGSVCYFECDLNYILKQLDWTPPSEQAVASWNSAYQLLAVEGVMTTDSVNDLTKQIKKELEKASDMAIVLSLGFRHRDSIDADKKLSSLETMLIKALRLSSAYPSLDFSSIVNMIITAVFNQFSAEMTVIQKLDLLRTMVMATTLIGDVSIMDDTIIQEDAVSYLVILNSLINACYLLTGTQSEGDQFVEEIILVVAAHFDVVGISKIIDTYLREKNHTDVSIEIGAVVSFLNKCFQECCRLADVAATELLEEEYKLEKKTLKVASDRMRGVTSRGCFEEITKELLSKVVRQQPKSKNHSKLAKSWIMALECQQGFRLFDGDREKNYQNCVNTLVSILKLQSEVSRERILEHYLYDSGVKKNPLHHYLFVIMHAVLLFLKESVSSPTSVCVGLSPVSEFLEKLSHNLALANKLVLSPNKDSYKEIVEVAESRRRVKKEFERKYVEIKGEKGCFELKL